jgi:2,4-dienoyl-CoA reductase (NADPH2)
VVLEQGFACARWPGWIQERTDLEQRLLKRPTAKTLWVVAGTRDMEIMRTAAAAAVIPARPGTATTILFMRPSGTALESDGGMSGFIAWIKDLWERRGLKEAQPVCKVVPMQGPPESLIEAEMEQGGFGAVILARNHLELWRERFLYQQRAKAVSLIGTHPRWSRVLVPLDLGLVSLLVLHHLKRSFMAHPELQLDFLHVRQGEAPEALKRWRDIHKILDWSAPARLRIVPRNGTVAATILGVLRDGDYGTLVMGKRGLSRIKQMLLGSVSSAVLQGLSNQTLLLID